MKDNTIRLFFALLKAGLWEDTDANINVNLNLGLNEKVDWENVYQLAEEQSVIGVMLACIERYKSLNVLEVSGTSEQIRTIPDLNQELLLQWIGEVQMLEQQNKAMNQVVGELISKMRANGIYTLLVKGQGVAQCYNRPLWRASGDVDFYLSDDNFSKAKKFFRPLVDKFDPDNEKSSHINMHYGDWVVEIHANQHCSISTNVNRVMDEVHLDLFYGGNIRSWNNGNTQVFLPSPDNDVLIVFVHFLNHFYKGGIGVRQICDWCRLLWTYKNSQNLKLLDSRIRKMGLMNVWKGFAAFAVEYLGMPKDAMPYYSAGDKWKKKADKISAFILEVGNMGHNRDMSYFEKYPYLIRKVCSMGRRCGDLVRHARIFPMDSLRFLPRIMFNGLSSAVRGE